MLTKFKGKILLFVAVSSFIMGFSDDPPKEAKSNALMHEWQQLIYSNYTCLNDTSLSFEAFREGLHGFYELKHKGLLPNSQYLTIVDFTQHSSRERLYVIDTEKFDIVYKTLCSHGKNTGGATAKYFSNKVGSLQSSFGFFIANETYSGKFDLAMRLDGLEYCNNNARDRGIVVHGANYATHEFMKKNDNVLGRSFGCPALPEEEAEEVIGTIKEGSCFYIYAGDKNYSRRSRILGNHNFLTKLFD